MPSKYAKAFHEIVIKFQQDVEFIDVLANANKERTLLREEGKLFRYVSAKKHPHLSKLGDSESGREEIVKHLRMSVLSSYLKDLYEEVLNYLQKLVYEAAQKAKDPSQAKLLLAEDKISLTASDIITYSSINDLIMKIAEESIRSLDKMHSTKLLLERICTKFDLGVPEALIEGALPFFEIRHKLVHSDGKADAAFKRDFPTVKVRFGKIFLSYRVAMDATDAIFSLVDAIDDAAIARGILSAD